MAEKEKSVNQIGTMAFWFGSLSTLSNSCIAQFADDKWQTILFSVSGIVVAVVSAGIVWLFCRFGKPLELVKYEAQLMRDIKSIENALSRQGISDEARSRLQMKLDSAVEKYATAGSDFNSGRISISTE
ncbi:hypothetical protein [Nitrincola lacisaponensis]|uniref:hypothetical protein n=1 Tax=Nitrincola lacisaponensis TaxID=267850 RepID=UPI00056087AA|nr:hypothetical protein [Nitrincola lacisaponensis]